MSGMPHSDSNPAPTKASGAPPDSWVEDHLDAVYRYARRRLGASHADDLTQQAFAALYQAHSEGRTPDDPGAYLFGTVRRRVADLLRRKASRPEPVSLPPGWEGFAEEALPDEVLAARELIELVHVALGFLPGPVRALLLARYRTGVAVAELAERSGTTPKAIELRLRRARQTFAERFRRVGRDWTDRWGDDPAAEEGAS